MLSKLVFILGFVILVSTFGSLFHLSHQSDSSNGICPAMESGQSICTMGALDHISAWQDTFLVMIPVLILLSLVVISLIISPAGRSVFLQRHFFWIRFISKYYIEQTSFSTRGYFQMLLSTGKLNPKLFHS